MIAPGPIGGTEGMDRLSAKGPDSERWSQLYPLGRDGQVQDVANAAVFLFSPAARYISGQVFAVDGAAEHLRVFQLPYPQSVLDPEAISNMIKPRL